MTTPEDRVGYGDHEYPDEVQGAPPPPVSGNFDPRTLGCKCDVCPLGALQRSNLIFNPVPPEHRSVIGKAGKVLAVGDFPGAEDVMYRRPQFGPSGQVLLGALAAQRIERNEVSYSNMILCRPVGNDLERFRLDTIRAWKKAVRVWARGGSVGPEPEKPEDPLDCCAPHLRAMLADADLVLPLGATPVKRLTNRSKGIENVRGGFYTTMHRPGTSWLDIVTPGVNEFQLNDPGVRIVKVVPTVSPAVPLRDPKWRRVFYRDVERAVRWVTGRLQWTDARLRSIHPTVTEVAAFLSRPVPLAGDIETTRHGPLESVLRCIGFYDIGADEGICIPWESIDGKRGLYPGQKYVGYRTEEAPGYYHEGHYSPDDGRTLIALMRAWILHREHPLLPHPSVRPRPTIVGFNWLLFDQSILDRDLELSSDPTYLAHPDPIYVVDGIFLSRCEDSELGRSLYLRGTLECDVGDWKGGGEDDAEIRVAPRTYPQLASYNACVFHGTPVRMWDGTSKQIQDVRIGDVVLGTDSGGAFTPSTVNRVYRQRVPGQTWIQLTWDDGPQAARLVLTPDHPVFTSHADYLVTERVQVGHEVRTTTPDITGVLPTILGTLLGDASFTTSPSFRRLPMTAWPTACLSGSHVSTSGWAEHKAQILPQILRVHPPRLTGEGGYSPGSPQTHFTSSTHPGLMELAPLLGSGMWRLLPAALEFLDPRGFAWWFCDVGFRSGPASVALSTCRYPVEDVAAACAWFTARFGPTTHGTGNLIRLGAAATRAFVQMIAPFVPESMRYKLPIPAPTYTDGPVVLPPAKAPIVQAAPFEPHRGSKHLNMRAEMRYCIGTETGNFFAANTLVHNCDNKVTGATCINLWHRVQARGQSHIYDFDRRQARIAREMCQLGIKVHQGRRAELEVTYTERVETARRQIRDLVGKSTFNPNSTPQLSELLYEDWGLPVLRLTDTGASSTDDDTLRDLMPLADKREREVLGLLRHFRLQDKTLGTVILPLRSYKDERKNRSGVLVGGLCGRDGRVHPQYPLFVPATGRFASKNPNCFDGETEVLTESGWIPFPVYRDQWRTAKCAQWTDVGDGRLEVTFAWPTAWHEGESDDLVSVEHQSADLVMTGDHRTYVADRKSRRGKWLRGRDLLTLTRSASWETPHAGHYAGPGLSGWTPDEIRLLVAVQADGHVRKDGYGIDFGFTKDRKIIRLRDLLTRAGVEWSEYPSTFTTRFYWNGGFEKFVAQIGGAEKLWGPWLLDLNRAQIDAFVDEVWHWDGCLEERSQYASRHKSNAEWVQILCALSGIRANTRTYTNQDGHTVEMVDTRHRAWNAITHAAKIARIEGFRQVYCVSMPAGTLVVRRHGKVTYIGQSQNITKDMRYMFVPEDGHVFLMADYDQIELRLFAACAKVKGYLDVFNDDGDPHAITAILIYGAVFEALLTEAMTPEQLERYKRTGVPKKVAGSSKFDLLRTFAKTFVYCVIYGGTDDTVFLSVSSATNPDTGELLFPDMTRSQVTTCFKLFMQNAKEIPAYWAKLEEFAKTNKFIVEPIYNRRRDFLEFDRNAILNLPIQAGAGAIAGTGLIRLRDTFVPDFEEKIGIVNQMHDAFTVEVPERGCQEASKRMEDAVNLRFDQIPGMYFSAEADIVINWRGSKKKGDWWTPPTPTGSAM